MPTYLDIVPRTPEWYEARLRGVTATEIGIILGLSPYVSPFTLWHHKRTGGFEQQENLAMRIGRKMEEIICDEFADQHRPEYIIIDGGFWANDERPWQLATPDRLMLHPRTLERFATVEAKNAMDRSAWGPEGSDLVPLHYRTQVLWQMDVLGVERAFLPVLFERRYVEFMVERDDNDLTMMRKAAEEFMDSLSGDTPPDVDWTRSTSMTLKSLYPLSTEESVDVGSDLAWEYVVAGEAYRHAEQAKKLAENRLRKALRENKRAVCDGHLVAQRLVYERRGYAVPPSVVDQLQPARGRDAWRVDHTN